MPSKCSVSGCKSNYKLEKGVKQITTFCLPKNDKLKQQWLRNIPTELGSLKNPRICIKHFEEKCIVRVDKVQVKNEIKEFDRINPKLQEDAIPTIFEGLPSYLSKKSTSVKRLANVEENNLELAIKASLESLKDYKSSQQINNVSDILKFYESNSCINKHWILYQEDDNVFFLLFNNQ